MPWLCSDDRFFFFSLFCLHFFFCVCVFYWEPRVVLHQELFFTSKWFTITGNKEEKRKNLWY